MDIIPTILIYKFDPIFLVVTISVFESIEELVIVGDRVEVAEVLVGGGGGEHAGEPVCLMEFFRSLHQNSHVVCREFCEDFLKVGGSVRLLEPGLLCGALGVEHCAVNGGVVADLTEVTRNVQFPAGSPLLVRSSQ